MGRPSNTVERREQIVSGLLQVMSQHGYEKASVVLIAKAARLAPGLVHYHFGSKAEILVELVGQLIERVAARYAARAKNGDAAQRLAAFIDAHLAVGPDADLRSVAAWSVIGAEAARQPEVSALYRKTLAAAHHELRRLLSACLDAEGRSKRQLGRLAAGILAAIEGAFRIAAAAPGMLPAGSAAPTVRRLAECLIAGQPKL